MPEAGRCRRRAKAGLCCMSTCARGVARSGVHLSEPTWGLVQSACHAREPPAPLARVGLPALATPGKGVSAVAVNVHTKKPSTYEAGSTYEHIFYEEQRDNRSILSRSGRAVAPRWRPSKEKNGRKRVGGFARCAPLNICPDWKGLGMQCDFMAGKTAVSARSWDSHNRSTQTTLHTTPPRRKQK